MFLRSVLRRMESVTPFLMTPSLRSEEEIAAFNASNLLRDTNIPPFPMTDGSSDSIRRSSPVDERLMTSPRGELLSSAMRHAAREPAVMTISA